LSPATDPLTYPPHHPNIGEKKHPEARSKRITLAQWFQFPAEYLKKLSESAPRIVKS